MLLTPEKSSRAESCTWPRCHAVSSGLMNSAGGVLSTGVTPRASVQLARPFVLPTLTGCERSLPDSTVLPRFLKRQVIAPTQLPDSNAENVWWPVAPLRDRAVRGRPKSGSARKRSSAVAPRTLRAAFAESVTVPTTVKLSDRHELIVTAACDAAGSARTSAASAMTTRVILRRPPLVGIGAQDIGLARRASQTSTPTNNSPTAVWKMRNATAIAVATASGSTAWMAVASVASRVPRPLGMMNVSTLTQNATGYAVAM